MQVETTENLLLNGKVVFNMGEISYERNVTFHIFAIEIEISLANSQPRSQGLRGETVTKTLVKFVLSFQNFGEKIACAVRHNRIAITVESLI